MRLRHLTSALVFAALALAAAGPTAHADSFTDTRIAAIEERIEEIQISDELLRTETDELAHTRNITTALRNTRAEIHQDGVLIDKLDPAIAAYRVSIAELEEMRRQLEDADAITPLDLTKEAAESRAEAALKAALEAGGKRVASKTLGIASWVGDFVEYVGKGIINDMNEDQMGEQVLFEMQKLVQALDRLVELETHRAEMIRTLHRLEELQRQSWANFTELATLRQELARLRGLGSGGKKPCKPAARVTNKTAPATSKTVPPKTEAEAAAELEVEGGGDNETCIDLTGVWTFQTSITLWGRIAAQPPLQAEFLRAAEAPTEPRTETAIEASSDAAADPDVPGYEIFALGTARAADPFLRCSAPGADAALSCERRVQPQTCPADLYVWEPVTLTLSDDQSTLHGSFAQTMTMDVLADPTGCTLVPFDGAGQIDLTFRRAAADQP